MPCHAAPEPERPSARLWASIAACLLLIASACGGSDRGASPTGPQPWLGFADAVAYSSGGTALTSLATRDLTGDGVLDLIAVARAQAVLILPGTAGGTFAPATTLPVGTDPLRAVTGDVDGDGVQDLVVIGHFDNAFHVRRGLGGGHFADAVRYPLRNHGRELAVADLNGDQIDDVVAVHDGSGQPIWISAFLGSRTGGLHASWEIGTTYFSSAQAAVGDFDGDGRRDVVVGMGDAGASLLLLRGLGTETFTAPVALPPVAGAPGVADGTVGVAAADLDGDGRSDLVVAHLDPARMSVRLSSAAGFGAPRLYDAPASVDVALGDVDGDGRPDAVVSHLEEGTIGVFPGKGDGSFGAERQFAAGPTPGHLVLADFDRDGLLDVATEGVTDGQLRVLRNRGKQPR